MSKALDRDEVARRAYELYLRRGAEHGHDLDDWLRAENEVRAGASEQPAGAAEGAPREAGPRPAGSAAKRSAPRGARSRTVTRK